MLKLGNSLASNKGIESATAGRWQTFRNGFDIHLLDSNNTLDSNLKYKMKKEYNRKLL